MLFSNIQPDIQSIREVTTVLCLLAFLAIAGWAFAPWKKKDFQEAEQQALWSDEQPH